MRDCRFLGRAVLLALAIVSPNAGCWRQPPNTAPVTFNRSAAPKISAVLTTDCGVEIDDQWALTHLLVSEEVDLRAVITTHASSIGFSSATSAQQAAELVARLSPSRVSSHPPVVAGSDVPLRDATPSPENAGVELLLRLSRGFTSSRRLVVFVIGAATDVASALLKDPSMENRVTIIAMGFDDWPSGGDVFNVKNDPLAWRIILDSDLPVVVGSSAVAKRGLRLTRTEAAGLMRSHGRLGEYLYTLFDRWVTQQAALVAQMVAPETWVVWDEVVVAYALGMAQGREVPRPRLQPTLAFVHPETPRRITWLTQVDTERVWDDFTRKIDLVP
jgi:purine nucleosidase